MKRIVALSLFALTFLLGCEEEKVEGPLAASGTMTMKINGTPSSPWFRYSPDFSAAAYSDGNGILILGNFKRDQNGAAIEGSELLITLNVAAEGQFPLRGNSTEFTEPGSVYYRIEPASLFYTSWEVDGIVIGTIEITKLDLERNQLSGTFQLNLKNTDGSDVIKLSEGSFTDLRVF